MSPQEQQAAVKSQAGGNQPPFKHPARKHKHWGLNTEGFSLKHGLDSIMCLGHEAIGRTSTRLKKAPIETHFNKVGIVIPSRQG